MKWTPSKIMQRLRECAHAERSDNACASVCNLLLNCIAFFILSHTTSSCPQGHRKRRLPTRAVAQRSACMNRRCSKGSKADSARTDAQSSSESSATCMTPNARSSPRSAAYACAEIRGTAAWHTASNPWTSGPPSCALAGRPMAPGWTGKAGARSKDASCAIAPSRTHWHI